MNVFVCLLLAVIVACLCLISFVHCFHYDVSAFFCLISNAGISVKDFNFGGSTVFDQDPALEGLVNKYVFCSRFLAHHLLCR